MLIHWIWLSTRKDLKERETIAVVRYFGDPESVYQAEQQDYARIPGITTKAVAALMDKSLEESKKILRCCAEKGIQLLTWQDAAYPARLKGIMDPPVLLYYKGVLPDMSERPLIGAVGTRSYSAYGMNMAHQMGYQLTRGGALVVSGMADGIDAGVISGALAAGGGAVGILGCGVDVVYPSSNRELYEGVLRCGCLISEFPPGTRPYKWNFPKRNRLISGVSNGVLVVEAPERSGALITARLAAEQGRDLFAVPGNANSPSCQGSNRLLRDGAFLVHTGGDILEYYRYQYPQLNMAVGNTGMETALNNAQSVFRTLDDLQRIIPETMIVKTACYIFDIEGSGVTGDMLAGTVMSYAGLTNVFAGSENGVYDIEDLKIVDPQYIFCPVDFKDNIMRNRELKELTAVKNGNVFEVEEKLARRNGRSIISFATTIAGIVYPELLEESTTVSTAMDPDEIADDKNEVLYKLGDSGDDIESFQKRLSQLGYYKGEITRVFDTATQEAIIYFQEVHKVEVTGVMDELTLEMLSGENVKEAPDKENDPQDLENPVGDLPVVDAEPEE